MNPFGWHILTIKPGLPIRVVLFVLLLASLATTRRLVAEEAPAAPTDASQTESAPESPPASELPIPPKTTSPPETLSQPEDCTDPEQILEDALAAMDTAALELEGDSATDKAVREQEQAVTLLQKLLSASQSSSANPKPAASSQPPAPESESDQPSANTSSDPNGSTGRRSDDENSQESSENVAGPAQSGASALTPNIRSNSVWGHLPPREQESLLRSLSDNFLPEYEAQIKRYYEALAEGKSGRGGR
ncbi:MAG: hypothetical protein DWH81_01520 [Planctomycetota bacterium]|nr:MAG: hypothetical protein DWH81_01520 [Planctomycetota bacterium]